LGWPWGSARWLSLQPIGLWPIDPRYSALPGRNTPGSHHCCAVRQLLVSVRKVETQGEVTVMPKAAGGSATRWGPLFGARAAAWAETWEGPAGWGKPVYEHVLNQAEIGSSSRVLDCGCGAGLFARMAAERGASVVRDDARRSERLRGIVDRLRHIRVQLPARACQDGSLLTRGARPEPSRRPRTRPSDRGRCRTR
jgi:hypothetical protein